MSLAVTASATMEPTTSCTAQVKESLTSDGRDAMLKFGIETENQKEMRFLMASKTNLREGVVLLGAEQLNRLFSEYYATSSIVNRESHRLGIKPLAYLKECIVSVFEVLNFMDTTIAHAKGRAENLVQFEGEIKNFLASFMECIRIIVLDYVDKKEDVEDVMNDFWKIVGQQVKLKEEHDLMHKYSPARPTGMTS